MKTSIKALFCAFIGCAGLAPAAQAATIVWDVAGTFTGTGDLPPMTNNLFSFTLSFDSAAPLQSGAGCATNTNSCQYWGGSIRITNLVLGGYVVGDTGFFESGPDEAYIRVRDNDTIGGVPPAYDGVSFQIFDYTTSGQLDLFQLVFRTTNTAFWSTSSVPTSPAGLASMELSAFQLGSYPSFGEDPTAFFDGVITSVTAVPEPASLALLGLGLAGLGLARRRKAVG